MSDMRVQSLVIVGAVVVVGTVSLWGQSLADVARKEEERRKAISKPAKVYTNKDLTPGAPGSASSGSSSDAADAARAGDKSKDAKDPKDTKEGGGDKGKEPVKDQKYWSGKLKELQAKLDQDESFADALQNKINSLTADFVNRDDPAQRSVIDQNRQKALSDLARLKKSIEDDKKAIADLQEEARRAGVPPGWLR
jgi:hypothetical protein